MENAINTIIEYKGKIEEIIHHAGEMIKMNSPSIDSVHNKEGVANFVTDYDVLIQEYLISELCTSQQKLDTNFKFIYSND